MISHTELRKGVIIIVDDLPYQIIEATPQRCAQRRLTVQTKMKNLINGSLFEKNVQQGETFKEAEIVKIETKFLYSHRGKFFFYETKNPSKRFELTEDQVGKSSKYLKPNTILDAFYFQDKIINVALPIKTQLKVIEAPPGVRGERSQAGTKQVTLETGAIINAPLFIKADDIIEINTETEEYVRRVE
jgi:elongation factor P